MPSLSDLAGHAELAELIATSARFRSSSARPVPRADESNG
jgi:hypothetical protein